MRTRHLRLTDPRLFDYPWIYATQTGWWGLSDAETRCLREFLLRGGYLVVDDFWGPEQWEIFRMTMDRVLPNRPIVDLAQSDSVMHVLYDIEEKDRTWIPGTRHLRRGAGGGITVQQPAGTAPAWRAIFDDQERMVVAVNFPPALLALYAAIALTFGFGGFLIWRGRALELDEKLDFGAMARSAMGRLEHFAAGYRILLPIHGFLRRLGSAASGDR